MPVAIPNEAVFYICSMPLYTDQIGRTLEFNQPPRRIVSLVPSLSELLYTLELEKEVVGITRFCVHPSHWRRSKQRIGGTKQVNIDAVRALAPDLVIASKEENIREQVEAIAGFAPVWVSDINNMSEALAAIHQLGVICNREAASRTLVHAIRNGFHRLRQYPVLIPAAYCIWKDPYMVAGGDTYINDMLEWCSFTNVFAQQPRYPTITLEQLSQTDCRLLLLSTEPYPFRQYHLPELQAQLPGIRIELVDGEMFSWYGSRMLQAADYFEELRSGMTDDR